MITMMIYVDSGRYRIFTHANRSGGVICRTCPDGQAGFILTDSLHATMRWIEQHEVRCHPPTSPITATPPAPVAAPRFIPQQRRPETLDDARRDRRDRRPAATYNGREMEEYQPLPDYVEGRAIAADHRTAVHA